MSWNYWCPCGKFRPYGSGKSKCPDRGIEWPLFDSTHPFGRTYKEMTTGEAIEKAKRFKVPTDVADYLERVCNVLNEAHRNGISDGSIPHEEGHITVVLSDELARQWSADMYDAAAALRVWHGPRIND